MWNYYAFTWMAPLVLFVSSLQFICIGILGKYLANTYFYINIIIHLSTNFLIFILFILFDRDTSVLEDAFVLWSKDEISLTL